MNTLHDKRTNCLSSANIITIDDYLSLITSVYHNRGGIELQRAPLKTKTGLRIRKRMVDDIAAGTVLPPIVLGATLSEEEFKKVEEIDSQEAMLDFLNNLDSDSVSIIDGMQRTTAIIEALKSNEDIKHNLLRIEVWFAKSINSLIYRMLVLNTGQVPWDIKRQLETIYKPILKEIQKEVKYIDILKLDGGSRRVQSSQYQSSKLIEFFLAFSSRKVHVDLKEKVAEDFARMEAAEATANDYFLEHFILALKILSILDDLFSECGKNLEIDGKFKSGKDIFTSTPAGIGFMAAIAVFLYGRPGFAKKQEDVKARMELFLKRSMEFIKRIKQKKGEDIESFLDLFTLNEKLSRRSGKVGEFEREFFFRAFSVIFESDNELESMEPCWAAY